MWMPSATEAEPAAKPSRVGGRRARLRLFGLATVLVGTACLLAGSAAARPVTASRSDACNPGGPLPGKAALRACAGLTLPKEKLIIEGNPSGAVTLGSPFTGYSTTIAVGHKSNTECQHEGAGCVFHHWNWGGEFLGEIAVAGCAANDPTCKVDLTHNPYGFHANWAIVTVMLDDNNQGNMVAFVVSTQAAPPPETSLSVSVSSSAQAGKLEIGATASVTAKVTAQGGSVGSISLGRGLESSGAAVAVTSSPAGLSGFSLANGASRSFVFKVKGAKAGGATLSVLADGKSSTGKVVQGSDGVKLRVGSSGLTVLVAVAPKNVELKTVPETVSTPGGTPVKVTVRVKNSGSGTVQHVFVNDKLLVVPLRQNGKPTLADGSAAADLGSLAQGATSKPVTFELLAKGDGGYSIEALASASQPGGGFLHGTGKGSVKVVSPQLSFDTKLESAVNPCCLWPAGVPYTVNVTVQDLSYRHSVALVPRLTFSGNAQGGELLEIDQTIPDQETASACQPGEAIELEPRQIKKLKVVVYTSKAGNTTEGAKGGGTRSVVVVNEPSAGIPNKAGNDLESKLTSSQILMSGQSRYEVSLADPGLLQYPPSEYDAPLAGLYFAKGLLIGIGAFEFGLAHGLLVDLPQLAIKGLEGMVPAYMALFRVQADLIKTVMADPKLLAAAITGPVGAELLLTAKLAPAMATTFQKIAGHVNQTVYSYFSSLEQDWNQHNYKAWAEHVGSTLSETGLNALTLIPSIATCVLLRAKPILTALSEAKLVLFEKATAKLGSLDQLIPASVALQKVSELVPGMRLNYEELLKLYGLTKQQVDYLRNFAAENKVLITVRSRAAQSVEWLKGSAKWAAAVLKPEQFKIKSVSWLDTEVLGYKLSDIGRVVMRRPITEAELRANLEAKGIAATVVDAEGKVATNPVWLDSFKLLKLRINEYLHARGGFAKGSGGYWKDIVEAGKEGKMKLRWNLADNSVDPTIAENGYTTYDFRLADENGLAIPKSQIDTYAGDMVPQFLVNGKWRCITGDVDFLSMIDAGGLPLDAAKRVKFYTELSGGNPVNMLHPAADTWTQADSFWFAAKENEFNRAGVVPEFAPDGIVRAVEYDARYSYFKSASNYRVSYDGGYLGPPTR